MSGAKAHYAELLGDVYEWSVSTAGDPFERAAAWLARRGLDDGRSYLDLGAGFGAHTIPLVRSGKQVTAVDFDPTLLGRLEAHLGAEATRAVVVAADLVDFLERAEPGRFDVVLCLGDTLTHLEDEPAIRRFLDGAARALRPQGRLALSFRDSTGAGPEGLARFVPVARDRRRTMHCLVEVVDEDHLSVTDLVTEVGPDGPVTRLGSYRKLRLSPARLAGWAEAVGLRLVDSGLEQRMTWQVFRPSGEGTNDG
jgi:SAM-dependent methyltransferase